jgi:hypothetical protein
MFFCPVWLILVLDETTPLESRDIDKKWKKGKTTVYQCVERIGKRKISL